MQEKENRLLELFRRLPESEATSLLDFAEFLLARSPQLKTKVAQTIAVQAKSESQPEPAKQVEPVIIPRADGESVIAAVKRLSATYHMLSKDKMLQETADLVSQSLMGGCDTVEVIDQLEEIFLKQYQQHTEN